MAHKHTTFKKPSPESLTSWRTKRYRQSLASKEEDKLWEIIEDFISNDINTPRTQLRFFKAIEHFTKQVHIERVRWKQHKDSKQNAEVEPIVNYAFHKWDVTLIELRRKTRYPHTPDKIYKARKYIVCELKKKFTYYRIGKLLGIAGKSAWNWEHHDIDIED